MGEAHAGRDMRLRRNTVGGGGGEERTFSIEKVTLSSGQGEVSLGRSHSWVQQCATWRATAP